MVPDPLKMLDRICLMLLQRVSIGEVLLARLTVVDGTVSCRIVNMLLERIFVDKITITVIAPSHVGISLRYIESPSQLCEAELK